MFKTYLKCFFNYSMATTEQVLFWADSPTLYVVSTNTYVVSIWHDFVKNENGLKNISENEWM